LHHVKASVIKAKGKQRRGKGFSLLELKKAGISKQVAAKLEIPTDKNRKTGHDQNVECVKVFAAKAAEVKLKLEQKAHPLKEPKKKAKT
jgi:ribosomal protein L13E